MKMMKLILILSIALAVVDATNVARCLHNVGDLPISTRIEGCTNPPCVFSQLSNAVIHLTFRAPRQLQSMRTLATAYLGIIPIAYDLGANAVTCNFLTNTRCPVASGTNVEYTLRMFIESWFPVGTSVTIEFRTVDQNNSPVLCLRVPIRIASPRLVTGANQLPLAIEVAEN